MSEEIVNNENSANNEAQNVNPETQNEQQDQQDQNTEQTDKGSAQAQETPKTVYIKTGLQEYKQRVTPYNNDARNALAREVTAIAMNKERKLAEKQALIDEFNKAIVKIENELKAMDAEAAEKSEIAVTGKKEEEVLCDVFQSENDVIYVEKGESPDNFAAIVARTQRLPEKQDQQEEK